jgi:hypothetical protein
MIADLTVVEQNNQCEEADVEEKKRLVEMSAGLWPSQKSVSVHRR